MDLESPSAVANALASVDYLPDERIAQVVFLANRLSKPILVEGPAGVGKTELAKALSRVTGRALIRLQCYEGLDESKALYEWNYKKQLLRIQADVDHDWDDIEQDIFSEDFLLTRPLLEAIRAMVMVVPSSLAVWHASTLAPSELDAAMRRSARSAPASSKVAGLAPFPVITSASIDS